MSACPYCGVKLDIPDTPGPIVSCDCGWYRIGALIEEPDCTCATTGQGFCRQHSEVADP